MKSYGFGEVLNDGFSPQNMILRCSTCFNFSRFSFYLLGCALIGVVPLRDITEPCGL